MAVKPGPKPGYKQSAEHIVKRIKRGADHPNWLGDKVSIRGGRSRARRWYPPGVCERCGGKGERHHIDSNTVNNTPSNVILLCRRCHMELDGRLSAFVENARRGEWKRRK